MNPSKKIPAGSLQFVVMIAAVIALLLGALILLTYVHSYFKKQSNLAIETVRAADRGFDTLLSKDIPENRPVDFQDAIEPSIDLTAVKDRWGVFERIQISATHQNKRFEKTALVSGIQTPVQRLSLYLKDNGSPLVLVGNAKIVGNIFLPRSGVKPGNIAGTSFYGGQLLNGRSFQSEEELPKLENGLQNHLESIARTHPIENMEFAQSGPNAPLFQSFLDPAVQVYDSGTIRLSGLELSGHILVKSKTKIIVDASTQLQDVLLIAPEVEIKSGFSGNIQVIAQKRVGIGEHVSLNYPSAVVVVNKKRNPIQSTAKDNEPAILLSKGSKVYGPMLFLGNDAGNTFFPQVVLEDNSRLYGELYCEQNLELRGEVYGSAYVGNLIVQEAGSIYRNHLYNGIIDTSKLPESYAGHIVNSEEKTIVQWLY